jgi:O-acetyl-ADP-ribose deacetylase (regulator of RNase III)
MAQVDARLRVVLGDITKLDVFVIVNAANSALAGGGGVDGAIHRAAGPELALASRALAPCKPGDAKLTPGFRLRAKHVIHTVGPVWRGGTHGEPDVLASCYRKSLQLAASISAPSIAFPAISTGIYGYPLDLACAIAVRECRAGLTSHDLHITLCMFDSPAFAAMTTALSASST